MPLSPDARIGAYSVTGQIGAGVYVQAFPPNGLPQQAPKINVDFHPVWTRGGTELVYVATASNSQFVAVSVTTQSGVIFGTPTTFTSTIPDKYSPDRRDYDVLPDGRFIGLLPTDGGNTGALPTVSEIRVVLNWFEELKARASVK